MKTIILTRKEALLPHRDDILALFASSFGSVLSAAVWTWAYIDNPSGHPVVALCHENGRLVGHYAIIPMPVRRADLRLKSFLSMTTMVAPTHRGLGLFVSLARAVYHSASRLGADCVLGFPNRNSTPGFRKHLGWILPQPDHIVTFDKAGLIEFARASSLFRGHRFGIDMEDGGVRSWRLSKPGAVYEAHDSLVIKPFGDAIDLVWCAHERHLDALPEGRPINVLVAGDVDLPAGVVANEYQFGGAALAGNFDPAQIARCMLLSDVF